MSVKDDKEVLASIIEKAVNDSPLDIYAHWNGGPVTVEYRHRLKSVRYLVTITRRKDEGTEATRAQER